MRDNNELNSNASDETEKPEHSSVMHGDELIGLSNRLNDRQHELILTPDSFHELFGQLHSNDETIAFKIHEDKFRAEFLTVWPIIRDPDLFEAIASLLIKNIIALRNIALFTRIVTCSPTMRYFLDEIRFKLDQGEGEVLFDYLGLHPMHAPRPERTQPFTERDHVLIITDVVSTGTLVQEMRDHVTKDGANVVGHIALFQAQYVDTAGLECRFILRDLPTKEPRSTNSSNFHALFDAKLQHLIDDQGNVLTEDRRQINKSIRIDRTTVFPSTEGFCPPELVPKLEFDTILRAKSRDELLTMGTFISNDKWISLAFDIEKLLNECATDISDEVFRIFDDGHRESQRHQRKPIRCIVTTPGRDNRIFAIFLKSILAEYYDVRIVLIPRGERYSERYSYFTPSILNPPEDGHVFLCLATVSTSEKLRALSAYLASCGVDCITAVTLIDRMNASSGSFLARVLNLQSGSSTNNGNAQSKPTHDAMTPAAFYYTSLFKIHDVSTEDMMRGSHLAQNAIAKYRKTCNIAFYVGQARNELKYFNSIDISHATFNHRTTLYLSGIPAFTNTLTESGLDPSSVPEAVAYALCLRRVIEDRSFEELCSLLVMPTGKEMTYALVRLAMLDAGLLKLNGEFRPVCEELIAKISQIEGDKRKLVQDSEVFGPDATDSLFRSHLQSIHDLCEEQERCIRVLVFLSAPKPMEGLSDRARQAINEILSLDNETDLVTAFMSSARQSFLWAVTLFLNAMDLRDDLAETAREFARRLTYEIDGETNNSPTETIQGQMLRLARKDGDVEYNLDFLNDVGQYLDTFDLYFGGHWNEATEFSMPAILSSIERLLYPESRIRHSFQFKWVSKVDSVLKKDVIDPFIQDHGQTPFIISFRNRKRMDNLRFSLTSFLKASGDLERAAPLIQRLLISASIYDAGNNYFLTTQEGRSAFQEDLQDIQDLVQSIRETYQLTVADFDRLTAIKERIIANIWAPNADGVCESSLYGLLEDQVFPIKQAIEDAIRYANETINDETGSAEFWSPDRIEYQNVADDVEVLGDRDLIVRAIENALENILHQLNDGLVNAKSEQIAKIRVLREISMGIKQIKIAVFTYGKQYNNAPDGRISTWQSQSKQLGRYSGEFTYVGLDAPEEGALATISVAESPFRVISQSTDGGTKR